MNVVILGAGVGGKLAAVGIKRNFPECNVILIGPESKAPEGLFYFNEKVPGIAEREIKVTYDFIGGDINDPDVFKNYQIKSRGSYDPSITVSSLNKVGTSEVGYLMDNDFDLSGITWIKENCRGFSPLPRPSVTTPSTTVAYDKLISTIPLPILFKIAFGISFKCEPPSVPIYIKEVGDIKKFDPLKIDKISVYYDLNNKSPYYRHSGYYDKNDQIMKMTSESIKEVFEFGKEPTVLRPGKILPWDRAGDLKLIENHYDLKAFGRYARWDYHYLVTDTYRDAINYIKGEC